MSRHEATQRISHGGDDDTTRSYTKDIDVQPKESKNLPIHSRIGIYLGCFLPGGNSAHNTIIMDKSRHSHQKITHSKKGMGYTFEVTMKSHKGYRYGTERAKRNSPFIHAHLIKLLHNHFKRVWLLRESERARARVKDVYI